MASNLHLSITGDASSALAELAKVQAAIDSLRGKTVNVNVRVDGVGKALADLAALSAATRRATEAASAHADAVDRASSSLRGHADAAGRVTDTLRDLSDGLDATSHGFNSTSYWTGRSTTQMGNDIDRLGKSFRAIESGAADANNSIREIGDGRTTGGMRELTSGAHHGMIEMRDFGDGVYRAVNEADRAQHIFGRAVRPLLDLGGAGSSALSGLSGGANALGGALGGLSGGPLRAAVIGIGLATVAAGAAGAATGALGVASAAALGGVGVALGAAAAGVTNFTLDTMKNSTRFAGAYAHMAADVQKYSEQIVAPYANALTRMERSARAFAPSIVSPLKQAFAEIGNVAERNLPSMVTAAQRAAHGFRDLTTLSAPAFDAFFRSLPGLVSAGIDPLKQVAATFSQITSSGQLSSAGTAFRSLTHSLGAFGSEILKIGAENLAPALSGMDSLTQGATKMANSLRPAIAPSISAFTDLGNAIMGGIGDASPAIAEFARTISENAGGIQHGVAGLIKGGAAVGGTITDFLGYAGYVLDAAGTVAEGVRSGVKFFGGAPLSGERQKPPWQQGGPSVGQSPEPLFGGSSSGGWFGGGSPSFSGWWQATKQQAGQMGRAFGELFGGQAWSGLGGRPSVGEAQAPPWQRTTPTAAGGGGGGGVWQALVSGFKAIAGGAGVGVAAPAVGGLTQNLTSLHGAAQTAAQSQVGLGAVLGGTASRMTGVAQGVMGAVGQIQAAAQQTQTASHGFQGAGQQAAQTIAGSLGPQVGQAFKATAQQVQDAGRSIGAAFGTSTSGSVSKSESGTATVARRWVKRVTDSMTGQAESGGQGVGALLGASTASSITKSESGTISITRRWTKRITDAVTGAAESGGAALGAAIGTGANTGVTKTETKTLTIIRTWVKKIIDIGANTLEAHSPSRVFVRLGQGIADGMAVGVGANSSGAVRATQRMADDTIRAGSLSAVVGTASDNARGVASDRGLQVGYSWGRSVLTGADRILKKDLLQAGGFPQIDSPQAKAALGALGLLGPAGSGAQIWKAPVVTLGAAQAPAPARFEFHLNIDGDPIRVIATQVVERSFDELAGSISRQVG